MKFRFTAEHFIGVLNIDLKLAGVVSNRTWERNLAFQIAKHANSLLEAEEAKCERVYSEPEYRGYWIQPKDEEHSHTALLWNVSPIGADVQSPQGSDKENKCGLSLPDKPCNFEGCANDHQIERGE